MIPISELKQSDVGRIVLYQGHAGEKEWGHVTSWNDSLIFVRFFLAVSPDGHAHPRTGETSEGCHPGNLFWVV